MKASICIASQSQLTRNLLTAALSPHFPDVQSISQPEDYFTGNNCDNKVLLWEVDDSKHCVQIVNDAGKSGRGIHNVILVLQSEDQFEQLHEIVGEVGAMLEPSVAPDAIARIAVATTQGLCIISRNHARRILPRALLSRNRLKQAKKLTDRERAVLHFLASGESDKAIAASMNIAESTVRVHIRSVLKKLGVRNRIQAALHAVGALHNDIPSTENL